MTLDRDSFNNLKDETESDKKKDRAKLQKELDERLKNFDLNYFGSKDEKEADKQKETERFWEEHKEALENTDKIREGFHFRDYGGSEATAQEQMEKYEKELQLKDASENMNEQWKQQEELARQHEKQNLDAQEKEKKEKEKKKQDELKQEQQNQHDQDVKDRAEEIRQRRLTNEFNRNR